VFYDASEGGSRGVGGRAAGTLGASVRRAAAPARPGCMGGGSSKSAAGEEAQETGARPLKKTGSWGLREKKKTGAAAAEGENPGTVAAAAAATSGEPIQRAMSDEKEPKMLTDVMARRSSLTQDIIHNKSVDSAGLAKLMAADAAGAAEGGDGSSGGRPHPPSIGLRGHSNSDAGQGAGTNEPVSAETPPFASFQGQTVSEKWSVMDSDMQEISSIDVQRSDGYKLSVADISINPTDKTIAVASKTGEAHALSISTGQVQSAIGDVAVRLPLTSCAHNCDGTMIATGSADKLLRIFSVENGRELGSSSAHQSHVTCVAFANRNPRLLASGGGDQPLVRVWLASDPAASKPSGASVELLEHCVLVGHWAFLTRVAFSGDDKYLASCSMDWTIRMWDIANGEPMVNMSFSAALVQVISRCTHTHTHTHTHKKRKRETK